MLKVGQQDFDNISLNIALFLAWLHNRFPAFLPVVMPVRGAFMCSAPAKEKAGHI